MSAAAVIAGISTAAKAAKKGWQAFCKGVAWKRKMVARAELEANDGKGKDIDGDGVVGGVGNTPRSRDRLRGGQPTDRNADAQRALLDEVWPLD